MHASSRVLIKSTPIRGSSRFLCRTQSKLYEEIIFLRVITEKVTMNMMLFLCDLQDQNIWLNIQGAWAVFLGCFFFFFQSVSGTTPYGRVYILCILSIVGLGSINLERDTLNHNYTDSTRLQHRRVQSNISVRKWFLILPDIRSVNNLALLDQK